MAFATRLAKVRDVGEDLDESVGCAIMTVDLDERVLVMGVCRQAKPTWTKTL